MHPAIAAAPAEIANACVLNDRGFLPRERAASSYSRRATRTLPHGEACRRTKPAAIINAMTPPRAANAESESRSAPNSCGLAIPGIPNCPFVMFAQLPSGDEASDQLANRLNTKAWTGRLIIMKKSPLVRHAGMEISRLAKAVIIAATGTASRNVHPYATVRMA